MALVLQGKLVSDLRWIWCQDIVYGRLFSYGRDKVINNKRRLLLSLNQQMILRGASEGWVGSWVREKEPDGRIIENQHRNARTWVIPWISPPLVEHTWRSPIPGKLRKMIPSLGVICSRNSSSGLDCDSAFYLFSRHRLFLKFSVCLEIKTRGNAKTLLKLDGVFSSWGVCH